MRSFSILMVLVTAAFAAAIPVEVDGKEAYSLFRDLFANLSQHEILLYMFLSTKIPTSSIQISTQESHTQTTTKNESSDIGWSDARGASPMDGNTGEGQC